MNIKYIGFYDIKDYENENRNSSLAGVNKMNYISNVLIELGYAVNIVSPSWSCNDTGHYSKRKMKIGEKLELNLPYTFGARNKITKSIRIIYSYFWLFMYLILNTKKGENIIVYHSLGLMYPILLAKKIKKFKLILEVEEIYQDLIKYPYIIEKSEYRMFEISDKYIFSADMLNEKLNARNKPYTTIYGSYDINNELKNSFNDNKIHAIYAGIIDSKKGGAFIAAEVAKYLDKNYHINIIGFGSGNDIKKLESYIKEIQLQGSCGISYDGIVKGKEYRDLLKKCSIGLSTQVIEGEYLETSFPSKILSYLCNGLIVVSGRIKGVEISKVGKLIHFYDIQNPEEIANVISKIDINKESNSIDFIKKLHKETVQEMKELILK